MLSNNNLTLDYWDPELVAEQMKNKQNWQTSFKNWRFCLIIFTWVEINSKLFHFFFFLQVFSVIKQIRSELSVRSRKRKLESRYRARQRKKP